MASTPKARQLSVATIPRTSCQQTLLRPARQRREELVQPPGLGPAFWQKATIEHSDDRLLRVTTQAKNGQVEPYPTKRLPEMAPESLLVEGAETGQVREIDTSPQREHCFEQLPQKLALPEADLAVVNVSHLPEYGGHHRREKWLWEHRPWGSVRLVTNLALRPIAFSCFHANLLPTCTECCSEKKQQN